jgi:hypothetical protein
MEIRRIRQTEAETTRFGLYRESSTSNWTSSP